MTRPRFLPKAPKGERIKAIRNAQSESGIRCDRCGRAVNNPARRHRTTDGYSCPGSWPHRIDELPPVVDPYSTRRNRKGTQ